MNLLILSLLMAFGGQTNNRPLGDSPIVCRAGVCLPEPCEQGARLRIGKYGDNLSLCKKGHWIEAPHDSYYMWHGDNAFPLACDYHTPNLRGSFEVPPGECEISLHPYPLWRMEAQEPQVSLKNYFCDGACMNAELMPTPSCNTAECLGENRSNDVAVVMPEGIGGDPGFCINRPACEVGGPIDVPAVQEPNSFHCKACPPGIACFDNCIPEANYTCSDPSRSLEFSVDGLKHWCHRMTP